MFVSPYSSRLQPVVGSIHMQHARIGVAFAASFFFFFVFFLGLTTTTKNLHSVAIAMSSKYS